MLNFYFKVSFKDGRADQYLHILAATAMIAWDELDYLLKSLEWDNIDYGNTVMIPVACYQNDRGEFFENLFK